MGSILNQLWLYESLVVVLKEWQCDVGHPQTTNAVWYMGLKHLPSRESVLFLLKRGMKQHHIDVIHLMLETLVERLLDLALNCLVFLERNLILAMSPYEYENCLYLLLYPACMWGAMSSIWNTHIFFCGMYPAWYSLVEYVRGKSLDFMLNKSLSAEQRGHINRRTRV